MRIVTLVDQKYHALNQNKVGAPAQLDVDVIVFWTRLMPGVTAHGFSLTERDPLAADHQVNPAHFHPKAR